MEIQTLEQIISEQPLFEGLDPSFTKLLVGCASNVRYERSSWIFREGEEANQFFLIRQGRVTLEIQPPHGKPILIETLSPGDVIGWSWLLHPHVWKFNARATEMSLLIALDGKCLRTKCEDNHDLGYEVMKRFARIIERRLEATRFQLLDVYAAH
jgi:CRP/FNR family transcriptional regulator, cyclic AMP receptor protein